MAYIAMTFDGTARHGVYRGIACRGMAYKITAYVGMACMVTAYRVMTFDGTARHAVCDAQALQYAVEQGMRAQASRIQSSCPCIASRSGSPTARLLHRQRRAGTENDRLNASFPAVPYWL